MVGWFLAKTTMGIMLCRLPDWRTLAGPGRGGEFFFPQSWRRRRSNTVEVQWGGCSGRPSRGHWRGRPWASWLLACSFVSRLGEHAPGLFSTRSAAKRPRRQHQHSARPGLPVRLQGLRRLLLLVLLLLHFLSTHAPDLHLCAGQHRRRRLPDNLQLRCWRPCLLLCVHWRGQQVVLKRGLLRDAR